MALTKQHAIDVEDVLAILEDLKEELDGSVHECSKCGRDSWKNFDEGRVANEVGVMIRKARKCLALIDAPTRKC